LTGFQVGANGSIAGGSPTALQLPTTAMSPKPTSSIAAQFNLDSRSTVPTKTPFDANDSTTYNYSNAVTVFDSLGNSHELSTFFVKTASNTWNTYATADGQPLATGGAFAPAPPAAGSNGTVIGSVAFDTNGMLTAPASGLLSIARHR
jgi:flagellar hook protein FlgE